MEIQLNEGCVLVASNVSKTDTQTIEYLRGLGSQRSKTKIFRSSREAVKDAKKEWSKFKDSQPLRNDFLEVIADYAKASGDNYTFRFNLTKNN